MPLYNRVKELRARLNINQQELGNMVGVSRQTISQIERGDYNPSILLVLKLAHVFNVSCETVFYLKGEFEDE